MQVTKDCVRMMMLYNDLSNGRINLMNC